MKNSVVFHVVAVAAWALMQGVAANAAAPRTAVTVEGGSAEFRASTNVAGIDVKGVSKAVTGRAAVEVGEGVRIGAVEAAVTVGSLSTGMKIRDEHMRKYIFTTESGEVPDIRFTSDGEGCAGGREFGCEVAGQLRIRGVAKPFTLRLRVREQGAGAFRVSGDGTVKLSEFGIAAPMQFGVRVGDEVAIHLEFTALTAAVQLKGGVR